MCPLEEALQAFILAMHAAIHLSPSSFMVLSPPSIFPLITSRNSCLSPRLWSPAIITELMQVLPLAQLRPTPNMKNGLHHHGMT